MAKLFNIYLARQKDITKYEIYKEGKLTGEIVEDKIIRKMLTYEQYAEFLKGERIFYISGEVFRTRNHKEKPKALQGRNTNNFNFIL